MLEEFFRKLDLFFLSDNEGAGKTVPFSVGCRYSFQDVPVTLACRRSSLLFYLFEI
jgi:hypothetical protein